MFSDLTSISDLNYYYYLTLNNRLCPKDWVWSKCHNTCSSPSVVKQQTT